jgi:metallo-beta-lactamase family protein
MVYTLNQLTEAGRLPRVPIFVDSPLSVNATEVYRLHPECFNEEIYQFLHQKQNPFGMENLTYIREVAHSLKLNDLKEAAIIISASGMAEAGRRAAPLEKQHRRRRRTWCSSSAIAPSILWARRFSRSEIR